MLQNGKDKHNIILDLGAFSQLPEGWDLESSSSEG